MATLQILGIGNAVTDIPVFLDNGSLLEEFHFLRGSMNHIDEATMDRLLERLQGCSLQYIAGGSAANAMAALAGLGIKSRFVGKIGRDVIGSIFAQGHGGQGVEMILLYGGRASGRAITFIDADSGERTFATCLGASLDFRPEELEVEMFQGCTLLHLEGYLLQCKGVVERAVEIAKGLGMKISIDLGSIGIVRRYRELLHGIVGQYADIVFANEAEAEAFSGLERGDALEYIYGIMEKGGRTSPVAVVKLGAEGSLVKCGDEFCRVEAFPANVVDTTGAGDAYAAGFLYAFCNGTPVAKCGEAGSLLASKVVAVVGAKIPMDECKIFG